MNSRNSSSPESGAEFDQIGSETKSMRKSDIQEISSNLRADNAKRPESGKENSREHVEAAPMMTPATHNHELCFACKSSLRKSPELISVAGQSHRWHPECFKCSVCSEPMDRRHSCHLFKEQIVCRSDYNKLTKRMNQNHHQQQAKAANTVQCARCRWPISSSDWVRKAANFVYHLACFNCDICLRQFNTGDQFTMDLQTAGTQSPVAKLLCRHHFSIKDSPNNARQHNPASLSLASTCKRQQNEPRNHYNSINLMPSLSHTGDMTHYVHARRIDRHGGSLSPLSNVDSSGLPSTAPARGLPSNSNQMQQLMIDSHCKLLNIKDESLIQARRGSRSPVEDYIRLASSYRRSTSSISSSSSPNQQSSSTVSSPTAEQSTHRTTNASSSSLMLIHQPHSSSGGGNNGASSGSNHCSSSAAKSKRVRTTFTDDQLSILQTHFQIDSNPDGQDLERIATITGLSKRVTQVWFQNSRARQKKYLVRKKPTVTSNLQLNSNNSNSDNNNANFINPNSTNNEL